MINQSEWEPILFNLGNAYRRMKQFSLAIEAYEQAMQMAPKQASIYSSLGFTYHMIGNINKAIEYYHKALAHNSPHQQDTLTASLLAKALEQLADMKVETVLTQQQQQQQQ